MQSLVDKRKVVVTEAAIRDVLRLDDAEGVDCCPTKRFLQSWHAWVTRSDPQSSHFIKPSSRASGSSSSTPFCSQWVLNVPHGMSLVQQWRLQSFSYQQDKRLRKEEMHKSMFKMLLLVMLLKEMILLLMEKFLLSLKNYPYHLLLHLLHHHNHLKISHQHPRYNILHLNHLRHNHNLNLNNNKLLIFPSLLPEALDICASLTRRVEHLEYNKVAQALEITRLKRRVKKLEKGNRGRIIDEMDKDDAVALMDDKEEDKNDEEAKVDENDQVQGRQAKSQAKIYKIDMDHALKVLSMQEDKPDEVQDVVDVVTTAKLITEVVTAASETVTAASIILSTTEAQVPAATITAAPAKVATAPSRRRKGVVIRDPKEESTTSSIIPAKTKSKDKGKGIMVEEPKPLKKKQQIEMDEKYARKLHAKLNKYIDWDVAIDHMKLKAKEDTAVQRYQAIKRKPQTEAQTRKNMMMYLKNVAGFRLDYFKGMSYDDIRPIFEAKFNSNVDFLLKTKEQMEEEESKALQRINETLAERAA
nr:hypothetical protein [Tanacetum cinerariifolium]